MSAPITDPYELGRKTKATVSKPRSPFRGFVQWELFGRSFGFFRFKKKHGWTDEQVEEFRRGFEGEPLCPKEP